LGGPLGGLIAGGASLFGAGGGGGGVGGTGASGGGGAEGIGGSVLQDVMLYKLLGGKGGGAGGVGAGAKGAIDKILGKFGGKGTPPGGMDWANPAEVGARGPGAMAASEAVPG